MNTATISPNNKLSTIIDFDWCKKCVETSKANKEDISILCPHYSINVQSKYDDIQQLDDDLSELSEYIGEFVEVSQYDDLIVVLTDGEDAYDPHINRQ